MLMIAQQKSCCWVFCGTVVRDTSVSTSFSTQSCRLKNSSYNITQSNTT